MEGPTITSNKIRFVEGKRFQVGYRSGDAYELIASASKYSTLFVCTDDKTIKALPYDSLLDFTIQKSQTTNVAELCQPMYIINLSFRPTLISIGQYGSGDVLLTTGVVGACPALKAFDIERQTTIQELSLSGMDNNEVIDHAWHPEQSDSLVALCTSQGNLIVLRIDRKNKTISMIFNNPQFQALTCCWSPKGKNLAIGRYNGQLTRLEPVFMTTSFTFKEVDKSTITFNNPAITPDHRLVKLRWYTKTLIICAHSKLGPQPDSVFSMTYVKPSKQHFYWTNLCFESFIGPNQTFYMVHLGKHIVCASSFSGEAAVISCDNDVDDLNNWKNVIIDEEAARIELPLDSNNAETQPRGVTIFNDNVVIYTSDGKLCLFKSQDGDKIERPRATEPPIEQLFQQQSLEQPVAARVEPKAPQPAKIETRMGPRLDAKIEERIEPRPEPRPTAPRALPKLDWDISLNSIKNELEFLHEYRSTLEEVNYLRSKIDEVAELHQVHQEVVETVKDDIEALDLGVLEDLQLIQYIKARMSKVKAPDPILMNKTEALKPKIKLVADKLEELNLNVEVEWEEFQRKKKGRRLNSLDTIYQTLVTNQKIINALRKKVSSVAPKPKSAQSFTANTVPRIDSAKMEALREYLSSRSHVPVRRPEPIKSSAR